MGSLIVIAGPTASGKTDLSISLARTLNAEIINADSRQMYKYMNIGTAKPSLAERASIPHHFIDFREPTDAYSAGMFETDAIAFLTTYFQSNEYAILVGGSGLYIKALIEGFDDLPKDERIRLKLNNQLETEGLEVLQERLKESDPISYKRLELSNPHRVIRALEVIELSGQPYSALIGKKETERSFDIQAFCLSPEREILYDRINRRVDEMLRNGLLDEVKSLVPFRSANALNTVGYSELFDFLDGKISLERAVELIKQHSRNYAKRQMTWFKKQHGFQLLEEDFESQILRQLNPR